MTDQLARQGKADKKPHKDAGPLPAALTTPIQMGKLERAILGVVGAALLAVGCWATFIASNDLATVAVVIVGAVFLVAATLGRWPNRLAWGDKVAEFYQEVVETTLATASPGTRQEVLSIAESNPAVRGSFTLSLAALHFESEAIEWLRSVVPSESYVWTLGPSDRSADAYISPKTGSETQAGKVGVVVKYLAGDPTPASLRKLAEGVRHAFENGFETVLVITNRPLPPAPAEFLRNTLEGKRLYVADVDSASAVSTVEQALDSVRPSAS